MSSLECRVQCNARAILGSLLLPVASLLGLHTFNTLPAGSEGSSRTITGFELHRFNALRAGMWPSKEAGGL